MTYTIGEEIEGGLFVGEVDNNRIILSPAAGGQITASFNESLDFCTALVLNDFSGWSLPTKEEIRFVCKQQATYPEKYQITDGYYWSSTAAKPDDENYMLAQATFSKITGYQLPINKTETCHARPIRKIPV